MHGRNGSLIPLDRVWTTRAIYRARVLVIMRYATEGSMFNVLDDSLTSPVFLRIVYHRLLFCQIRKNEEREREREKSRKNLRSSLNSRDINFIVMRSEDDPYVS